MEIGGYFPFELQKSSNVYHDTEYTTNSGRASLNLILSYLKPTHVYLPYYTCNALLEPFQKLGVAFSFYHLDKNLEIVGKPTLKTDELLVYVNYFDIKRRYVDELSQLYNQQLIVDCTQAYFVKGNGDSWFFNSTRKFFGVPDGSDLYVPSGVNLDMQYQSLSRHTKYLTAHLIERFNGNTAKGYTFFQRNEILNGEYTCKISLLSESILSHVDFQISVAQRDINFNYVHQHLAHYNDLVIDASEHQGSFYPFLSQNLIDKKQFWDLNYFLPNFWTDCLTRSQSDQFSNEKSISKHLLPIPIDHRYTTVDLQPIINLIKKNNYGISNQI